MLKHRLIEIDPAESLDALDVAEQLEAGPTPPHHGGVERPATQVVHGNRLPILQPLRRRIVHGRSHRLGQRLDLTDIGHPHRLLQHIHLVGPPIGGVGHRHPGRRSPLARHHLVVNEPQQPGQQRLGRIRGAAHDHRRRITDPPLELPHHPTRIHQPSPIRRLPDQHIAVLPEIQNRRNHRRTVAQGHDLRTAPAQNAGRRIRGAEIDTQIELPTG